MIDTEDLEFIGNVLNLQNNDSVDLTLLKSIAVWVCGVADYLLIEKYLK